MPANGRVDVVQPAEYERLSDLLDGYFQAVREYNAALGAFDLTPAEIRDARAREALNYSRVRKYKDQLTACGISV